MLPSAPAAALAVAAVLAGCAAPACRAAGEPESGAPRPGYAAERLPLAAEYAGHRYRVSILRPAAASAAEAPPEGHPVLFMLDGNAVEQDLAALLASPADMDGMPPVVVTIGYETDRRFEVRARAYDYTPALTPGAEETDPLDATRRTGGADGFLAFIADEILPALARRVPVDARRLGLWGHSYGGLFVLHTLWSAPERFRCRIAASPSRWWRDGFLLSRLPEYGERLAGQRFSLLITRGGAEANPPPDRQEPSARSPRRERIMAGAPADAVREFAARLGDLPGADVGYLELPEQTHGQAFTASLLPSLRWFAGCAAR